MIGRRDARALLLLAAAIAFQFAPVLFTGRSYFLGDLTYFYHPWHTLSAQMLQGGRLPLWNPYGYMGMPMLATMQTGTFAPSTVFFHLFGFAAALKLHLVLAHSLAAFFGYLWLRRSTGRAGAFAGAAVLALGGILLSRIWIPNQAATLAWLPALFLFSGSFGLLTVALAFSLLAGYPQMWAGMIAAVLLLPWARKEGRTWVLAPLAAAAIAACMLLPGAELALHSNRGSMTLELRTAQSLAPAELPALLSPLFVPSDPSGARYPVWKTVYFGFLAVFCAGLGLYRLRRRWPAALFILGVIVLAAGGSNPLSLWLWDVLPPLRLVRFPVNLAYLLLAAALPLIALGLRDVRRRSWLAAALTAELLFYGWSIQPTMPDSYFQEQGVLVTWLQTTLGSHRYAVSPQAALLLRGKGETAEAQYLDVKHRLYGSSGLPFRLASAVGMGESLLLGPTYQVLDFLYTRPSAQAALAYLRWTDTRYLLTKDPPAGAKAKAALWEINETVSPGRAWWLPLSQEGILAGGFEGATALKDEVPLTYEQPREDRFTVSGWAPGSGWILIANPLYPGWRSGSASVPALTAFQRVKVEAGEVRLRFAYRPAAFCWGALLSVLAVSALAWRAFDRARAAARRGSSQPA